MIVGVWEYNAGKKRLFYVNLELFTAFRFKFSRLCRQKLQSFNFGEQLNTSIDLSAFPAGTYFLRSNQGWVEKVVLQK